MVYLNTGGYVVTVRWPSRLPRQPTSRLFRNDEPARFEFPYYLTFRNRLSDTLINTCFVYKQFTSIQDQYVPLCTSLRNYGRTGKLVNAWVIGNLYGSMNKDPQRVKVA